MYDYYAQQSSLNLSTSTLIKAAPGRVARVNVVTAGSTAGALYDAATVGGAAASNEIAVIPNTVGQYQFDWPFFAGLVFVPGTGQVISISWS